MTEGAVSHHSINFCSEDHCASSPPVKSSTHIRRVIAPAPISHPFFESVLFPILPGHCGLATSIPLPTRPSFFGQPSPPWAHTKCILSKMTETLDGEEDRRISPGAYSSPVRRAHSLCCSCSLLVSSLTAQLGLYVPSYTPCRSCLSRTDLPTTVHIRKSPRSGPLPASSGAVCIPNKRPFATILSIGRLESSSLAPVPHRHSRSSRSSPLVFIPVVGSRCTCFLGLIPWPSSSPASAYAPLHTTSRK